MSIDDQTVMRLARLWGLLRLALGAVVVLKPEAVGRVLAAPDPGRPIQRMVVRNVGGRDLAIGLALMLPLRRSRAWLALAAMVDGLDLGFVLLDWRGLPPWQRRLIAASAAGSAVTGALLAVIVRNSSSSTT